jgi:Flp pilus assembly pilin Flp
MLAMILLVILIGIAAVGSSVLDWWTNINTDMDTNGF